MRAVVLHSVQLVSATGEGATAALMVRQYLEREKLVLDHRSGVAAMATP